VLFVFWLNVLILNVAGVPGTLDLIVYEGYKSWFIFEPPSASNKVETFIVIVGDIWIVIGQRLPIPELIVSLVMKKLVMF